MADTLGIGIIGAGVIFEHHAQALASMKNQARIVGIAELNNAKRAAATDKFFIPVACEDYRQLLDRDDVDVVNVCTPPSLHEEMVAAALAAGKFVLCEKPLAPSLSAADRIIETEKRFPGKLSVVYQLRYQPEFQKMLWLRDRGVLGELQQGVATRIRGMEKLSGLASGWWGRWDVAGGGVAMTQFVHHLDQLCQLFGVPMEVQAMMDTFKADIESEDTFMATIRFADGALANCYATIAAQKPALTLDVVGTEASVHIPWTLRSHDRGLIRQAQQQLKRTFPQEKVRSNSLPARVTRKIATRLGRGRPRGDLGGARHHAAYFRHVFQAIGEGRPLPISAADARISLELCTAIYASGLTGRPVALPLEAGHPLYDGISAEEYAQRSPLQKA